MDKTSKALADFLRSTLEKLESGSAVAVDYEVNRPVDAEPRYGGMNIKYKAGKIIYAKFIVSLE